MMNDNLTTTQRHYDLFHLAMETVEEAKRQKHLAFIKADHNPSRENMTAFLQASAALRTAEDNLKIVKSMKKFFKS